MITQRDLAGIMPNTCRPGVTERPQHPELPGVAAVVAEQLGSSLLRVTLRLTSLASQARPPLRDHLLAQVEEIDELMHAVRELLVPAAEGAARNSVVPGRRPETNPFDADASDRGVGESVRVGAVPRICPTRVTRAMAAARSPASTNVTG
jgi:hypothetical protein